LTPLDTDTQRHIDTARDIRVGKVPDPKCQVEQTTIAFFKVGNDGFGLPAVALSGVDGSKVGP